MSGARGRAPADNQIVINDRRKGNGKATAAANPANPQACRLRRMQYLARRTVDADPLGGGGVRLGNDERRRLLVGVTSLGVTGRV